MATPYQKTTFFFLDNVNNCGWTESWYWVLASANAALTAAVTLITTRVALLMDTCQLTTIRSVTVGPPRDSLFAASGVPALGTILHGSFPAAGPWDALLIRKDNDGTYFNKVFMHGVPVGIFTGRNYQNTVAPGIAFQTALAAYLTAANGAGASVRKIASSVVLVAPVLSYAPVRRTEHRIGRPFDPLRGRRAVA
jgi:hypothetical protein